MWSGRGGHSSPPGRTAYEDKIPPQLSDYEIERSKLFSEYLTKVAAETDRVRRFREEVLAGGLLSPEEARALLRSPVAAHRSSKWFENFRVPIVGHTYLLKEDGYDEKGAYSLIEVSTAGPEGTQQIKDRRPPALMKLSPWDVADAKAPDARSQRKPQREFTSKLGKYMILLFPGEDGQINRTLVKPTSLLGRLHQLVGKLIEYYPWLELHTAWFVLTGETPWVAPMTWGGRATEKVSPDGFGYEFIILQIEPWVSAETVERTYREIQRNVLGKDNRKVGEKNRALFGFVTDKLGPATLSSKEKRSVAPQLIAQWDEAYPNWAYGKNTGTFWRDYNKARKLILSLARHPLY